jgi:hypothetical protein
MADAKPMAGTKKCGAKTRTGGTCGRPAGWGTDFNHGRCKLHGGRTPTGRKGNARAALGHELQIMGMPREVDPHDAMLQCIYIAAGELDYATERVGELKRAMVPTLFGPKLNEWINVRQQAMDRLVSYSKIALAAGVEERRVRVAEQQGAQIVQVLRGVLTELGVADHPDVPAIVSRHLRAAAGLPVIEAAAA